MSVELEFKRGGLDLKDSHMSVMIYSLYLGTQDGFGFLKPDKCLKLNFIKVKLKPQAQ